MSSLTKFQNRSEAGQLLGEHLRYLTPQRPVVLGLPRGGVPVAFEVAQALASPLDVLVVRKLGVPFHREFAFGAIGEDDAQVLNTLLVQQLGLSNDAIAEVARHERAELIRRVELYRGDRSVLALIGRTVVIVDDGLATGATARVAIEVVRARGATRIIVAVPVSPRETVAELRTMADEVISLLVPARFESVGEWYEDFSQTTDDEVTSLLRKSSNTDQR
jgi:putative phosphoribosyl transferase